MKKFVKKSFGLMMALLLACAPAYAEEATTVSVETHVSAPIEKPVETSVPAPVEKSAETSVPAPAQEPTLDPTEEPTPAPAQEPTPAPAEEPTSDPAQEPTPAPAEEPTEEPTSDPTEEPALDPTAEPALDPTEEPALDPTEEPTPAPERRVLTEYVMDEDGALEEGDEFFLKATLVGFEGAALDLQWQYDANDGNGFQNAPGESKGLLYRARASVETVSARWRIVVTVLA